MLVLYSSNILVGLIRQFKWRCSEKRRHTIVLRKRIRHVVRGMHAASRDPKTCLDALVVLRDTVISLAEYRVTPSALGNEFSQCQDIFSWLYFNGRESVRNGSLSWGDFGFRNEIDFGCRLLVWGVYLDLLAFDSRGAFGYVANRNLR